MSTAISSKKGFTLVELLIVISIIAILVGTVALALTMFIGRGEETACLEDQRDLQTVVNAYHVDNDRWPTENGEIEGDLFYGNPVSSPLIPDYIFEVPGSDDKCDWQINEQGVVKPGEDVENCPCD